MKINFKKITPILAGALLLGSTMGFAAAADLNSYPSPFVAGGVADVAVVYGAAANTIDMASAALFTADLSRLATTASTSAVSGESVKIETSSEKLNIGENLTTVRTTAITKSDLTTLLEKKTYQSKDGVSYDYEQELTLAPALLYTHFADIDYGNKIPTFGITKASNTPIMNYTVRFVKTVESDVDSTGRLEDLQDSDITLLGKSYRILNAYNGTNLKLELMSGAVVDTLLESANKSYTIGGKSYDIAVSNIATDGAALTVNGQTTPKMTAGSTYKLLDGTQIGVRTIWYQSNKVSSVEFSLGAEKLTLENGQKLKMNDENVNDVVVYFGQGSSSAKRTMSSITLAWITNDKLFITPTKEAILPGLKSIKITMTDFTTPKKEIINIANDGERTIYIRAPIKSGTWSIPILTTNVTKTGYNKIGDESYNLRTAAGSEINFNKTIDRQFVASWASTTAAESYLLKATISRDTPSSGINSTDIIDVVTGSTVCEDRYPGTSTESCTIGNVVINVKGVDVNGDGWTNITGGSGVSFNKLYTANGLMFNLPVDATTGVIPTKTYINLTANPTSWNMMVEETDKNNNMAAGKDINVTLGVSSAKAEVSSVVVDGAGIFAGSNSYSAFDVGGSSTTSKYVAYVQSDLATKFTTDTKPDQNTLEIEYYGGESYGNVYLAGAGATAVSTGGSAIFDVAVPDTDAIPNKNLIVIGGSAVNKVSAQLLGLTYPAYGAAFTEKTGVGADEAILKIGANPSYSTKVALLVAGWEAKDTKAAAKALISKSVALAGKESVVLKTVTEATTALKA